MPVGLGIGCSHAPSMFVGSEHWPGIHTRLVGNVPPPPEFAQETPSVVSEYIGRIRSAFARLHDVLADYAPDVLIVVGDDQREVFGPDLSPSLAVYVGEEVSGTTSIGVAGQSLADGHITLKCASEAARNLRKSLIADGFDVTSITELQPKGRPEGGLGHAFIRPCNVLDVGGLGIPVIPIFLEAYHPPMPSAARCLQLGDAIRAAFDGSDLKVAVLGSGGLSHDPLGPRAGWIDEPLDRWFLEQIAAGRTEELSHLFAIDSATLRGGTGEIRSWLVAAAAMRGVNAEVVDYVPAYHTVTGLGFAYWRA